MAHTEVLLPNTMPRDGNEARRMEPAAFDVMGAARYIGMGKTSLYAEIKAGNIVAKRFGRRTVIPRSELDNWLASLPKLRKTA